MSALQQRTAAVTDTRLAAITHTAANLKAQLCELNRLRDRVRRAQLSARSSRRIDHSKERRILDEATSIDGLFPAEDLEKGRIGIERSLC